MFKLTDIRYETRGFWVLDAGAKGFEVYMKGTTHSTRVAAVGQSMGLSRAVAECNTRQKAADVEFDKRAASVARHTEEVTE